MQQNGDDHRIERMAKFLEREGQDESLFRLIEEQKREREMFYRQALELLEQLDAKQALQLEITRMKGQLQVMQHLNSDGEMRLKMEELTRVLSSVLLELN